ncbi:hypothetical protein ACFQ1R_06740 [Mariniflexile jejuense]|uniref:Lipocalin-like domain-containing protein n=1 Tax=Mariniflexile jejuense TaxID=1173582 RepID=A0ABW3JI81_9FLAO
MKTLSFILCATLLFSCNKKNKTEIEAKPPTLEGAWELVSFLNYRDDGSVDTIKSSSNYKQMKMFSQTKVMWSRLRTSDSLDWFGVGNYTLKDGMLTEILDYGSKAMESRIKEKKKFVFNIMLDKNKFTQIEVDSLEQPTYGENYKRIE